MVRLSDPYCDSCGCLTNAMNTHLHHLLIHLVTDNLLSATYLPHSFVPSDSMAACGRPLGMRLSKDKKSLVFADAFHGIFSLALTNGLCFCRFLFVRSQF